MAGENEGTEGKDGLTADDLALLSDDGGQKTDDGKQAGDDAGKDKADADGKDAGQQQKTEDKTGEQTKDDTAPVDWRAGIADAKLAEYAKRFTSPGDLVQTTLKLRDEVSLRIKLPGPDASDEDKAKYRKALGVPDKPEDYKIELPDGMEATDADQQIIDMVLPIAHANGVPAAALNGLIGEFLQKSHDLQTVAVQEITKAQEDAVTALKKEWGADYEPHLNLANRAAEVLGGEDFKTFLSSTQIKDGGMLGDHPAIVRFLATIGRRTDEGDLMIGSTADEKASIRDQIAELNRTVPVGSAGYKDPAHQKKLTELYEAAYGRAPIIGSQTRAA
ncbi:MAG: hypothetical protein Q8P46_00440 [Hyphomicrobiales bacterium]|nr:hypothetical protein [Hyphomicrobiales bacterium]